MSKPLFLVFLIIICSPIFASKNQSNNYEHRLKRAVDLVFNFEFKEAEKILLELSELNKSDARTLLYLSNIYVWKFIGDRKQSDFDKFERYSKQTIQRAENQLKINPDDLWSYFSLSSIYGYRALMFFMNRDFMDGFWAVRKSISWTNDLLNKNPEFYDGYLWRGIIYYSLHQVPSAFRSLLSIVGLKGDIKQGFKDIQLVSQKGNFAKVEADYFLSQFYSSSLNDNKQAYELLKGLAAKYPENELFSYSTAAELIKLHRIDEAKNHLTKIIKNNSIQINAIKELSYFLLGDCFFYQNDFSNAVSNYELFISRYNQNQYKPTAYFRSGIAYYFLNDKEKAKSYLEKSLSVQSRISEDKFHQRYARKIINSNFDNDILKIFFGWNLLRSGKFENSIKIFDEILSTKSNSDLKIAASYLKGLCFYKLNDFVSSKNVLLQTIKYESKDELWAKAFAYLYLARIEFNLKNFKSAENYISKLLELNDYDFESSVESQAKNLLTRIKFNF